MMPHGAWLGVSIGLLVLAALCLAGAKVAQGMSDGNDAINRAAGKKWEGPRVRALTGVEPLAEVRELSRSAKYLITVPAHSARDPKAMEAMSRCLEECFGRMWPDGGDPGVRFLLAPDDFVFYEIAED